MTIQIADTVICAGSERRQDGAPMGPSDVSVDETPGAAIREYVGADRVEGEHVKCDAGTLSFGVTRVFPTVDEATAYAVVGHRAEPCEGELTVDGLPVYPKAVVTAKRVAQVGVAVAVNYTIQG